jgi:hypothetical protein
VAGIVQCSANLPIELLSIKVQTPTHHVELQAKVGEETGERVALEGTGGIGVQRQNQALGEAAELDLVD